jgi:RES domain-containing protein
VTLVVYRLSKERYRDQVFSGAGGLYADGRWTQRGRPVIYTSQSISLAVLEFALNYKRHGWLPSSVVARADIPDGVAAEAVSLRELPENWRDPEPPEAIRRIGRDWLRRAETVCLKVPSAIVPEESNYLLNPLHPDFGKLVFGLPEPFHFDRRLARARRRPGPRGSPRQSLSQGLGITAPPPWPAATRLLPRWPFAAARCPSPRPWHRSGPHSRPAAGSGR